MMQNAALHSRAVDLKIKEIDGTEGTRSAEHLRFLGFLWQTDDDSHHS